MYILFCFMYFYIVNILLHTMHNISKIKNYLILFRSCDDMLQSNNYLIKIYTSLNLSLFFFAEFFTDFFFDYFQQNI